MVSERRGNLETKSVKIGAAMPAAWAANLPHGAKPEMAMWRIA
jgi:hypothetical protein